MPLTIQLNAAGADFHIKERSVFMPERGFKNGRSMDQFANFCSQLIMGNRGIPVLDMQLHLISTGVSQHLAKGGIGFHQVAILIKNMDAVSRHGLQCLIANPEVEAFLFASFAIRDLADDSVKIGTKPIVL